MMHARMPLAMHRDDALNVQAARHCGSSDMMHSAAGFGKSRPGAADVAAFLFCAREGKRRPKIRADGAVTRHQPGLGAALKPLGRSHRMARRVLQHGAPLRLYRRRCIRLKAEVGRQPRRRSPLNSSAKRPANPSNVVQKIDEILASPSGQRDPVDPVVRSLSNIRDKIVKDTATLPDGSTMHVLEDDPRQLYGIRQAIGDLLSPLAQNQETKLAASEHPLYYMVTYIGKDGAQQTNFKLRC